MRVRVFLVYVQVQWLTPLGSTAQGPATTAVQVSITNTSPHTDDNADVAGDITATAAAARAIATLYPMNDPVPDPELERLAAVAWRDASAV
eukprot:COSAG06_NODE_2809_length_6249_cov_3.516585_2_plen_91_part_00